jgi:hypothetical protein
MIKYEHLYDVKQHFDLEILNISYRSKYHTPSINIIIKFFRELLIMYET